MEHTQTHSFDIHTLSHYSIPYYIFVFVYFKHPKSYARKKLVKKKNHMQESHQLQSQNVNT